MGVDMQKKIAIEVPEQVAQAYEKASASDRKRAQRALAYSLMSREKVADELKEILDPTGKTAKERGLTKDKLNQLLSENGDSMGKR
jgi:TFIIF-interacting CTD phosphatase-like protein